MHLKKMEIEEPLNLVICGVGGQGNVLAARIIASAAIREGFFVTIGETYGAAQRGGSVQSHVRISNKEQYAPCIPRGKAHVILGFEPIETVRAVIDLGNPYTEVILNPKPIYPISVISGDEDYPLIEEVLSWIKELVDEARVRVIEATEIAKEVGDTLVLNMVMVGCLAGSGLVPLKIDGCEAAIKEVFVDEKETSFNLKAFYLGVEGIKKGYSKVQGR
jgi:indolepyruvate ferredoxin oxidoreductase beta subunit